MGRRILLAKPQDIIDYDLVWNVTVSRSEMDRYRFMAQAVTENNQQAALKGLYLETNPVPSKLLEPAAVLAADIHAKRCFSDSDYRETTYNKLEHLGYIPDGRAFLLSLPALATIERLLVSAEKRFLANIKELERRLAKRETQAHLANSKVEN